MKKIIFFLSILFISPVFGANSLEYGEAGCPGGKGGIKGWIQADGKFGSNGGGCNGKPDYPRAGTRPEELYCYSSYTGCTCPSGKTFGGQLDASGESRRGCVKDSTASSSSQSSSSSSRSSSVAACPSGQSRDSNGNCNTCTSPQVKNILTGVCEIKKECVWPEKYQSLDNTCHSNPNNCAYNTGVNVITGGMCEQGVNASPYCPPDMSLTPTNTCLPSATSSSGSGSSSGAVSSTPSSSPSSSGSNSSSRSVATNVGDNTDQTQSTSNSQSIPLAISNSDCLNSFNTTACNVMQNCQLTFGVNNCIGVTANNNCPNSYVVNGQKMCVLSTSGQNSSSGTSSGSGSNGSASGECDASSKNYLRCLTIKELQIPTDTGEFTGTAAAQALQDANEELQQKVDAIKSEMNTVLNVGINGSGTITDNCLTILGVEVCFGFAKFSGYLSIISWAIMLLAYLTALFVILRK